VGIEKLQRVWTELGERDPFQAILTSGVQWDEAAFFQTGIDEIRAVIEYARSFGVGMKNGKALDFGCGVGRLTQALAAHFNAVEGVDISPSLLALAEKYNRCGERCTYHLHAKADLRIFPDDTFDFVYSSITLQHMEQRLSMKYIREFVRVLRPDGVLVFQAAAGLATMVHAAKEAVEAAMPRALVSLYRRLKYGPVLGVIEMHGLKERHVGQVIRESGARIVDVVRDDKAGPNWISLRYCVRKGLADTEGGKRADGDCKGKAPL
jgi:ubiquinone/menaquinone biosynthesis C-methylase UbiE